MALPVKYIPLGRAWPASPYSQWDLLAWHGPSLGLPEGPLDLIADRTGGLPWVGKPFGVFPFTQLWVHWISIIWPKTFHNPEFQCCTFFFLGYKKNVQRWNSGLWKVFSHIIDINRFSSMTPQNLRNAIGTQFVTFRKKLSLYRWIYTRRSKAMHRFL